MNDLEQYFTQNTGRLIHKWIHYFEVYDRHFSRFRNQSPVIVEIGVFKGGSLQMWKEYFGRGATIIGIDVDPKCKSMEENQVQIFIGSQSDRNFLRKMRNKIPPIDILIDDGGHTMEQQIVAFEELFDHVKEDGIYLCEDLHTSYRLRYGGGYKRRGTFVEHSKELIDKLNAWHSDQPALSVDSFTSSTNSLHFYDSIVVIEKRKRVRPTDKMTGGEIRPTQVDPPSPSGFSGTLRRGALLVVNQVLRFFRLPAYKTSEFWGGSDPPES